MTSTSFQIGHLHLVSTKCVHLSIRPKVNTTYYIDQDEIPKLDSHRNLGIIISDEETIMLMSLPKHMEL